MALQVSLDFFLLKKMQAIENALRVWFMKGRLLWTSAKEPVLKEKALALHQKIDEWMYIFML